MNDEKNEYDTAGHECPSGREGTVFLRLVHQIFLRTGKFIDRPNNNAEDNVANKNRKQYFLDDQDDEQTRQQLRVLVECRSAVVFKQQEIASEMDDEINAQANPR